ncbi:hypothetical protein PGH45_04785 [Legionella pneumophila]|nr:hypothetical protein [Legionella pneumophila]WBV72245.1 hypothetical protein PGH42_04425 [Legionella pneumophila]
MKDFVIVGAGPIGLYWAARLAQIKESSGLPINIVVIDPRAGNYNRERIVSNEAIKSISSRFSISMPSGKGIRVRPCISGTLKNHYTNIAKVRV